MGGKSIIILIVGLFIIASLGFVFAEYALGTPTYEIETEYGLGQGIDGWISIRFINASNSSIFEDSLGNSMTLIELLNENPGFNYTVNSTYGTIDSSVKSLYLDENTFKVPSTEGTYDYEFDYDGEEIFTEQITVVSDTDNLNYSINSKLNKVRNLKLDLEQYSSFQKTSINFAINLSEIEQELINLLLEYENATNQAQLDIVSLKLDAINVPKKITLTGTAHSVVSFPLVKNINLQAIEELSETSYDGTEEDYKNAALNWIVTYLDIKLNYDKFSANYESSSEVLVNVFEFSINKKVPLNYPIYVFIGKTNNTLVEQEYQEQGNYYVFEISENSEKINFSTKDNFNFANINFFVSPAITELVTEDLEYEEGGKEKEEEKRKWTIFILIMILLLIFGLILYLILQTWYKKRYEDYLFPNKNDLFNLANYITNAKKRGLDNEQIRGNLKKARWSSEQMRYALRKYSGRRTGMYEIAMRKALEKKQENPLPKTGFQQPL